MHYYQHNVGDYARDTSHLTVIEHGIYRLLLDWCYLNEKPIPTERAMRVGRGYPAETQSVLSEFFTETPDGWEHGRVLREIEKYHRKAKSNRENGMKGGRPKANANPMGCDSPPNRNPNQEPRTKNQEKDQKQESSTDDSRASSSDDAPPTRSDPIPYQAIVDAYNATMTGLAKVRDITGKRRTRMRTAWTGRRKSVAFWEAYFAECQRDDFLSGKGPYGRGHENWRPDFDYLTREDVIVKTYERAIDRMERGNE